MSLELDHEMILECWETVRPTERELDEMCDAADSGDTETAIKISDKFWERIFHEA